MALADRWGLKSILGGCDSVGSGNLRVDAGLLWIAIGGTPGSGHAESSGGDLRKLSPSGELGRFRSRPCSEGCSRHRSRLIKP